MKQTDAAVPGTISIKELQVLLAGREDFSLPDESARYVRLILNVHVMARVPDGTSRGVKNLGKRNRGPSREEIEWFLSGVYSMIEQPCTDYLCKGIRTQVNDLWPTEFHRHLRNQTKRSA